MAKGYVRPRGKNKWQLEVDLGSYIDPETGKKKRYRKYRTITTKSSRQAELELARFVAEVTDEKYYEPEKMNFVDFVNNEWLPKCASKRLAHTTLEVYKDHLENRIIPAFKYLRMDQVKPIHILDFLDNLQEPGMRLDTKKNNGDKGKLSSATIYYHYRVLNNIFSFAEEIQIINSNPVKKIKKPKVESKEVEVYTLEETTELLKCLESENHVPHWQIIIKLAITTGMRRSELFGLEFKHFNYEEGTVHVKQALTYSKDKGYQIHEIKKGNRSANQRVIVLSPSLIKPIERLELQRKKERLAAEPETLWRDGKYNFLLCDETGKPFNPDSLSNWWERFIKRHKLKYINLHALRHTSATLLINEGVHAKIISERLGHNNISTTMNIYGHSLKQADKLATEKLDYALNLGDSIHQ